MTRYLNRKLAMSRGSLVAEIPAIQLTFRAQPILGPQRSATESALSFREILRGVRQEDLFLSGGFSKFRTREKSSRRIPQLGKAKLIIQVQYIRILHW